MTVEWTDWKPFYLDIVRRLDLDIQADMKATKILDELLESLDRNDTVLVSQMTAYLQGRTAIVFGAGPSLDRDISTTIDSRIMQRCTIIAADGALEALRARGLRCHIVVTDLDGDRGGLQEYVNDRGTLAVIHAHGDNISSIKTVVPRLTKVIGTTQVQPTERVHLWGGFTDGDRACYMAASFGASTIILAGMDFGDVVGRWSKPQYTDNRPANQRKKLKLAIGASLLDALRKREPELTMISVQVAASKTTAL
ncbi:MAG: 6-hydroxymethyl-7,8-dihydropterin pyrophosphokinase [Candidatus Thorarchaeota archaeon]|nr:MAG: 6-hydroxymethyl-7,8-dihydropterin pyrophosphokinase [Candidatus Thorarchaeota archaeon]